MIAVDFDNWQKGRVPSEADNFGALLFMLIAKADPVNREKLRREWPEQVDMWENFVVYGGKP